MSRPESAHQVSEVQETEVVAKNVPSVVEATEPVGVIDRAKAALYLAAMNPGAVLRGGAEYLASKGGAYKVGAVAVMAVVATPGMARALGAEDELFQADVVHDIPEFTDIDESILAEESNDAQAPSLDVDDGPDAPVSQIELISAESEQPEAMSAAQTTQAPVPKLVVNGETVPFDPSQKAYVISLPDGNTIEVPLSKFNEHGLVNPETIEKLNDGLSGDLHIMQGTDGEFKIIDNQRLLVDITNGTPVPVEQFGDWYDILPSKGKVIGTVAVTLVVGSVVVARDVRKTSKEKKIKEQEKSWERVNIPEDELKRREKWRSLMLDKDLLKEYGRTPNGAKHLTQRLKVELLERLMYHPRAQKAWINVAAGAYRELVAEVMDAAGEAGIQSLAVQAINELQTAIPQPAKIEDFEELSKKTESIQEAQADIARLMRLAGLRTPVTIEQISDAGMSAVLTEALDGKTPMQARYFLENLGISAEAGLDVQIGAAGFMAQGAKSIDRVKMALATAAKR